MTIWFDSVITGRMNQITFIDFCMQMSHVQQQDSNIFIEISQLG